MNRLKSYYLLIVVLFIATDSFGNFDVGFRFVEQEEETSQNPLNEVNKRIVTISGLGNAANIKAKVSIGNTIRMHKIRGNNLTVVEIKEDLNISQILGLPIHGILGSELFRYFIVKIDYKKKELTLYKYGSKKHEKKFHILPIEIHDNKPYISSASYKQSNGQVVNLKMLLDLGESKPISIFVESDSVHEYPSKFIYSHLGKGLSGTISGYITRNPNFSINDKFTFKDIITSYPDEQSLQFLDIENNRDGSIGSGLLRRFILVFDYQKKQLAIRKNGRISAPFSYDRAGVIISAHGENLDQFKVEEIINFTPAYFSILEEDDEIIKINKEFLKGKKLAEVNALLNLKKNRKTLRLTILRQGKEIKTKLDLFDFL